MASYGQQIPTRSHAGHAHGGYTTQMAPAQGASAAPAGTFSPGTKIQVGGHRVVIQRYLSEGGFAHVYLVKLPKPVDGTDQAVLKRVAVPDKDALRGMRTEVETMKRLKGHRPIVTYIDSHASEMGSGGYEVFLLMEYCSGGGLIDFMNTRLQHRLTEPEIIKIFSDIAEGVACMHYLKPALLHRDLKIENVLITSKGSVKRFKLCDFGSASPPKPAPTSVVECRLMEEDVQRHTTLQYRSPEMVDVYRKQPLDEKSDIWALGVFLYKLCYYTTPFEDQGQLAILNASYKFPPSPPFSDRLKRLIASMLRENMQSRPNIYQVLKEACAMQGREVPIHDIYSGNSKSESQSSKQSAAPEKTRSQPAVGAVWSPPAEEKPKIPEVTPMRRGRPTAAPIAAGNSAQPSGSSGRGTSGDPFAALDSKTSSVDEFSSRFPSLDQFSLLHEPGSNFDFTSPVPSPNPNQQGVDGKATERLADEVFASSLSPPITDHVRVQSLPPTRAKPSRLPAHASSEVVSRETSLSRKPSDPPKQDVSRAQSIISSNPELQAISSQNTAKYVSTGTSTSDLPFEGASKVSHRVSQIYVSEPPRSSSLPVQPDPIMETSQVTGGRSNVQARMSSYQPQISQVRQPAPARQSLDVSRPSPDSIDVVPRTNLSVNRSRPQSTNFDAGSTTLDFLRERETISRPSSRLQQPSPRDSPKIPSPNLIPVESEARPETNDLDFLRDLEDSDSKHSHKRSSLTSITGSKMLATKFGDAFKKFEGHVHLPHLSTNQSGNRSPSPPKDRDRRDLTPIAGSEATDGRSDDGHVYDDDSEYMSPAKRRSIERRRLEEEERRVEAAQAEYRRRVADSSTGSDPTPLPRSIGGVPRALSIQNRVQSLLNEDQRSAPVQKTAQGYGKYSDAASTAAKTDKPLPEVPRKPVSVHNTQPKLSNSASVRSNDSAPPALAARQGKPAAPKKPARLNSLPTGPRSSSPNKATQSRPAEQLIAVDLPGQPSLEMTAEDKDNYIRDFSQRFPSVSAMEGGSK